MAVDLDALRVELGTNPRYDAAVRSGKNRDLLVLLNEDEPAQTTFRIVPANEVREAIGDGIRGLTAVQIQALRLFVGEDGVDFTKKAIRDEIREIFSGNASALARLQAVAIRPKTYGEAFGGVITLRNLWATLKDIPKSYMAQYFARG